MLGAALALASPAAAQTIDQFDSVSIGQIPSNSQAVAGYLNGSWPTFGSLVAAHPSALRLPITVHSAPVAGYPVVCEDSEPGNPPASTTGPWAKAEIALGVKPCVYSMLSWMPAIKASLRAWLGPNWRAMVLLWDANWTFVAHIDPGYDGTQFTDKARGLNLDESLMSTAFYVIPKPAPAPTPKPKPASKPTPKVDYGVFLDTCFPLPYSGQGVWGAQSCVNEQLAVKRFDGAMQHEARYRAYIRNVLQPELRFLAGRIAFVAINEQKGWGGDKGHERGPRFQLLIHRVEARVR